MPDQAKTDELRKMLTHGLQRSLLHGALMVVNDRRNPVRAHLFAAGLRELFTLTLDILAPDDDVKKCSWFVEEPGTNRPTRRQRAIYATRGGLADDYLRDELEIDPATLQTDINKAFADLNKRTHVRPDTHLKKPAEIEAFANAQIDALVEIFRQIDELRTRLARALETSLENEAIEGLMRETILSLDEISAQYAIESVWVDKTKVTGIDVNFVHYHVSGSVDVQLNWGPSGEDGASMNQSFPFACETAAFVDDPKEFVSDMTNPMVDTSSWFGHHDQPDYD